MKTPISPEITLARRFEAHRDLLRYRASSIATVAELGSQMLDDMASAGAPPYATTRSVGALLDVIAGAARHLDRVLAEVADA